ncbi:MAG: TIM44-like domain-containing protein [Acutalibacteraceae bacterium]
MKKKWISVFLGIICLFSVCTADFSCVVSAAEDNSYSISDMRIRRHRYSSSSSSSSRNMTPVESIITFAVFAVFVGIILANAVKKHKSSNGKTDTTVVNTMKTTSTVQNILKPMSEYNEVHPYFEMNSFCKNVSEMYINIQHAKTNRQLYSVHSYFTDELFAKLNQQINDLTRMGRTEYVENITVMSVKPLGWKKVGSDEILTVQLIIRIVNYIVQDGTERIISGSKTEPYIMTYEWDMVCVGHQAENELIRITNCPRCNAPWTLGQRKCEYCNGTIELPDDVWVIQNIKCVSQRKTKNG